MTEQRLPYGKPAVPAGLCENVLYHLQKCQGRHAAINRDVLAGRECVSDRKIRAAIEELRRAGHLIGSTSSSGGYYMICEPEEFDEFIREYKSRAARILENCTAMERSARRLFTEQPELL